MNLETLYSILTGITGFENKVAYYDFPDDDVPDLPYICYSETATRVFAADGISYHSSRDVDIELYSKEKSEANEALVETALTNNGIIWNKSERYLDTMQCHQVIYSVEV